MESINIDAKVGEPNLRAKGHLHGATDLTKRRWSVLAGASAPRKTRQDLMIPLVPLSTVIMCCNYST